MSNLLQEMLKSRDWVLADGATGTSLFAMGLPSGEAPELWNEWNPERVRELTRGFVAHGADLVLSNTFGGNRYRLKLHGREQDARALSRLGAKIARSAVRDKERPVVVAGSMGPTGEILEPVGTLRFESAVNAFEEQAIGLLEGGVDVLWGETISSREEARAIAHAANRIQAPYCMTFSFDTAGRTMMGMDPAELDSLVSEFPSLPLAIGANCGTGASDLLASLLRIREAGSRFPLIAKANAGIPEYVGAEVRYNGTPSLMGRFACLARDAGARIIGGCCGASAEHVASMRMALEDISRDSMPTLETIRSATGEFAQIPSRPSARSKRMRRRRRIQ